MSVPRSNDYQQFKIRTKPVNGTDGAFKDRQEPVHNPVL